jgi:hypothetical protein
MQVPSFIQDNVFDLHSMGTVPEHSRQWLRGKGGVGRYRSCQKQQSQSLHDLLSAGHHLLGISFTADLKPYLCAALTT